MKKRQLVIYLGLIFCLSLLVSACGEDCRYCGPHTYTVTYNGNGNTDGSSPVDSNTYQSGKTVTVLGNTGNLVKTGCYFTGWNTEADGSGTVYSPGNTFKMSTGNLILYAMWTVPTYTVTYKGNGMNNGSLPVDSNTYQWGQIVTVLGNTGNLFKYDYYFTGWNTESSGSGTTYMPGNTFKMGTDNIILYAMWSAIPAGTVAWTYVSGALNRDQKGIYGAKGVAAPTNIPSARYRAVSWIDSNGNLWLFSGFGYDSENAYSYLNDLWKFDGTNWTWVSGSNLADQAGIYGIKGVAAPTNIPSARSGAVSWIDSSGNFWLFGGIGVPTYVAGIDFGYLSDLWKFDGTNWTWVSGPDTTNQPGINGAKGVAAIANEPGRRYGAVSWIDSSDNLWLFGGSFGALGGKLQPHSFHWNDLWKFDGINWIRVSGSDTTDQAGVYGAKGVASPANVPGARDRAVSWIDSSGNLWLFGGHYSIYPGIYEHEDRYFNDLWKFDGTNWTWVSGSDTTNQAGIYGAKGVADPTNVPGARSDAISWIDKSGNLWLSGGVGYAHTNVYYACGHLNDLWKFDGTNWTWMSGANYINKSGDGGTKGVPAFTNRPGARKGDVSWIDQSGNLWLFGGYGYDSAGAQSSLGSLNDLWRAEIK